MLADHVRSRAGRRFLVLYEIGRGLLGRGRGSEDIAVAFALAGLLNIETCVAAGAAYIEGTKRTVAALDRRRDSRLRIDRAALLAHEVLFGETSGRDAEEELCAEADALRQEAIRDRQHGRYAQAEFRYRWAYRAALAHRDWNTAARSIIGVGMVKEATGSLGSARYQYTRALRVSRLYGVRVTEGMALHALFLLATEARQERRADRLAQEAYRVYSEGQHGEVLRLAHDAARHWLLCGDFEVALPVLQAALPLVSDPAERALVWGNIARAAGGMGKRDLLEHATAELEGIIRSMDTESNHGRCLVGLAIGWRAVGPDGAQKAANFARRAAEVALRRGEVGVSREAGEVLAGLAAGRSRGVPRKAAAARTVLAERLLGALREHPLAA